MSFTGRYLRSLRKNLKDPLVKTMASIRETQKKYCSRALAAAIVIGLCLILLGMKPIAKGLILGSVFSIVNFILIGETLPMRMGRSGRSGFMNMHNLMVLP